MQKGNNVLRIRKRLFRPNERVEHWSRPVALVALVLLAVLVAGCGSIGREVQRETATPRSTVAAVAPTDTAVPPTIAVSPPGPTATPTQAMPTARAASPSVTLPPGSAGIAIGIYEPQSNTSGAAIDRYLRQVGNKPAFAWQPMPWQRLDGSQRSFDAQVLEEYRTRGIMPGLTWEPSKGPEQRAGPNQPEFSWKQLFSGRHDAYITQFAKDAAAYRHPFIVRILHEMTGTWYPWGYGVNGNSNVADFVTAFKHIVDIFRAAGATNVQFVWNPTVINAANIGQYGPMLKQAYPGDNYVDWVALDGYNSRPDDWRSLHDIFQPSYELLSSFSKRPMMLFEVGSLEDPQNPTAKANWIKQGFLTTIPNEMPNVKVAVWFNSEDGAGRDFSLYTSQTALNAWKQVVSSPLYQGKLIK